MLLLPLGAGRAAAHEVPDLVHLHGYVRAEGEQVELLLRVPLVLLLDHDLPKRAGGFLDLDRIDEDVRGASAGRILSQVGLYEDGVRRDHSDVHARISPFSDDSFRSYETAQASITAPPLASGSDVYWNQGFFDLRATYPVASRQADLAFESWLAPEVRDRLRLAMRVVTPDGDVRAFEVAGHRRFALDPSWHHAARLFVAEGVRHILSGIDHLLFLLALVVPLRRLRSLVGVVTAFTVAHSVTLVGAVLGLAPAGGWFQPLVEVLIALSILYMAIDNVLTVNLRRRWLVTAGFGLVHGFGFASGLEQEMQFAGDHLSLALVSFNVGVELGQLLVLLVVVPMLVWLFRVPSVARYGIPIVSLFIGHAAYHWTADRIDVLREAGLPSPADVSWPTVLGWVAVAALAGAALWLVSTAKRRPGGPSQLDEPSDTEVAPQPAGADRRPVSTSPAE